MLEKENFYCYYMVHGSRKISRFSNCSSFPKKYLRSFY